MRAKKILLRSIFILTAGSAVGSIRAGEVSVYYLPNLAVQYEGTGYRQFDEGWELKVKPQGTGAGVRWRHELTGLSAVQTQYWRNDPYFSWEDGNSKNAVLRQTGQTRLGVQTVLVDYRRLLEGIPVEAVAGAQGVYETFQRKDIVFNLASEPGRPAENLSAGGLYIGFHGGSGLSNRSGRARLWYWDGEALLGHLFLTHNTQKVNGGSIHRDGYTYAVRLETGVQWKDWRLGVGQIRQMIEITVPGGKSLPTGAAASLPINKIDFDSPFVSVSYAY